MSNISTLEKSRCYSCRSCFLSCPAGAIEMAENGEGFFYPEVNFEKCVDCGICAARCPAMNRFPTYGNGLQECFAMVNKNHDVLMSSTSGGVFYQLAYKIIENGGVVFGAAYDECMNVCQTLADSFEKIKPLQGSKYVFCDTGNSFFIAKKYLYEGKQVLYSGSPCQIAGLKAFLGGDFENLFTVDIICHGTPSQKLFHKYLEYLAKQTGSTVVSYSFRDKEVHPLGAIKYKTKSGALYVERINLCDPYGAAFARHENYKMACYTCSFASLNRISDLTIGDFWGIRNFIPDFPNENGVSVCLVNTQKGRILFDSVKGCFLLQSKISATDCALHNPCLRKPEHFPKTRTRFYEKIDSLPADIFIKRIKRKRKILFYFQNFLLMMLGKIKKICKGILNR